MTMSFHDSDECPNDPARVRRWEAAEGIHRCWAVAVVLCTLIVSSAAVLIWARWP